ncbi:MAG: ABC transporter substrate-binding protein [Betaproteobacteria bacterium]|nr:ABC transporter substrate-binding protein [Betaproteobacteria bacterium]
MTTSLLHLRRRLLCGLALAVWSASPAWAVDEAPDAFVRRFTSEMIDLVRTDKMIKSGDLNHIATVVDARVLPHLNFQRMTAQAVGPGWRQATPEQKSRIQAEFKILLVRTYSGALTQIGDQTVLVKPLRGAPTDAEVLVRSELKGRGEPIQLDYRLEKTPGEGAGWKIYNLNVMGIWLIDTYRSQFAEEINAKGLDGLINTLAERNRSNAKK